jgi:hypothetical protein
MEEGLPLGWHARQMAPPPTAEEIMAMSVKELKAYLTSRKVDFSGCFEKSELQSLAKSTL